jgi:ribonuclease HI
MTRLRERYGGADTLWLFTDGARREQHGEELEACAGAFVATRDVENLAPQHLHCEHVPAGPIARIFTAELLAINAALEAVSRDKIASARGCKTVVLVTDSKSSLESLRSASRAPR